MAEKVLSTRILNKIDTLENWNKSSLKIKQGEICLATVAATAGTSLTEPVIMMKIGNSEEKTFAELPWSFYAKASDVLSACKTTEGLTAFVKEVIDGADMASNEDFKELVEAVETLNGTGDGSVAKKINDAITALDLENTYAAKEHTHTKDEITDFAHRHAIGEVDGLEAALESKQAVGDYATKTEAQGYANAKDSAIAAAADAAAAAQAHSEGVAADLAEAVEALEGADEAQVARIAALEGQIVGLSGAMHFEGVKDELPADGTGYEQGDVIIVGNKEYVLNGSKFVEFGDVDAQAEAITELTGRMDVAEGEIDQLQKDVDAAEAAILLKAEQSYVDEAIGVLEEADEGLAGRIATLEGKFGGAAGSVEDQIADAKQAAIDAAAAAADEKDAEILKQAKQHADDEDAKIEARVEALETASATHALASDVTALTGRVGTLEGEMDTAQADIDALEDKVGNTTVAAQIEAAIAALKIGDYAKAADLANAVARIAQNETDIAALEANKANDADLAAIAKSGNVNDLVQTAGDILVFDCGSAE